VNTLLGLIEINMEGAQNEPRTKIERDLANDKCLKGIEIKIFHFVR